MCLSCSCSNFRKQWPRNFIINTRYTRCVRHNESSRYCYDVRPSVCLSGTGVHYDHTVHFGADLSLRLDSPMFWIPWYQSMSTYSQPSFSSSTWMCKLRVKSQERLKIGTKLLLSDNGKSYMPRRLAQQRMTLSEFEWPFHASRAISAIAELLVGICRYIFRISRSCLSGQGQGHVSKRVIRE